jgi:starch-binding outer membrane protein, SusD/RagB family
MKKIIICTLVLFISLLISSCEKILDVKNLSAFNPSDTWNNQTLANAYLTDLYASASPGWSNNSASDNGVDNYGRSADESIGILAESFVQTTNSNLKYWPYTTIRKINVLLNEIDEGSLSDDVKDVIKGQAYFLRAYQYFTAVKYHGGVPIIKTPQLLTDDLMVSRNTTNECFDFIIEDLDNAISTLPNHYTGSDYGRIDKAIALAFKGRVLLYKASPQFNPSNPYGNAYWQDAYTATKAAKDQLETLGYGLVSNYDDIFLTEQHKEAVWPIVYTNPGKLNYRERGTRPLVESVDATGYDQPIWELVESYPMLDGKQPGSSSKYLYDVQTYWQDRDPRFASTIIYNACPCPLAGVAGRRVYTDGLVGNSSVDGMISTTTAFCRTGFFCRKGLDLTLTKAQVGLNAIDWLEIRFAEVLMNYAEAANETDHPDAALAVLKQIRQRAGIEPGIDGMYGITATTKEEIRAAIVLENRIEFAFEGSKRFWDLRRLRMFSVINGMHKNGLQPVLKTGLDPLASSDYLPSDFTYTVREPFSLGSQKAMVAPESYYFFPILKDEIEKDPNLIQNTNWESGTFDPTLH